MLFTSRISNREHIFLKTNGIIWRNTANNAAERVFAFYLFPGLAKIAEIVQFVPTVSVVTQPAVNTNYSSSDTTNLAPVPAVSTDAAYLYLLNSRYSRISSLIRRFS